jgi:hypothetical protein
MAQVYQNTSSYLIGDKFRRPDNCAGASLGVIIEELPRFIG